MRCGCGGRRFSGFRRSGGLPNRPKKPKKKDVANDRRRGYDQSPKIGRPCSHLSLLIKRAWSGNALGASMSTLSAFLSRQRIRWYRRGIDPSHHLRRRLAYHVALHGFEIGDYSQGEPIIKMYDKSRLMVGKYSSIATGVTFILGGRHRTDTVTTHLMQLPVSAYGRHQGDIVIGSDVWIAANALILAGVTIGDGAVIGAGSVVVNDVPPYGMVLGNPARIFGKRFSDDLVAELMGLRWWDLERAQIETLRPLLLGTDIELFIAECRKLKGLPPREKETAARAAAPAAPEVPAKRIGMLAVDPTEAEIRQWCAGCLAKELNVPPSEIDPAVKFARLGIDSTIAITFTIDLADWLGVELPSDIMFEYPTIADLARHLAQQSASRRRERRAG
jgi:acetyltransferase-like isoleucine patch superfamily enzyme/acyl carrier protein